MDVANIVVEEKLYMVFKQVELGNVLNSTYQSQDQLQKLLALVRKSCLKQLEVSPDPIPTK